MEELSDDQIGHQLATNVRRPLSWLKLKWPYHTTKCAIVGFFVATAQDIVSFKIQTTQVEPGGARTDCGFRSVIQGSPIPVYEDTPVDVRRRTRAAGKYKPLGDAAKMASTTIASVDQEPAPRRLILGSDAFTLMHKALTERLATLEAQKDLAFLTDATDRQPASSARQALL